MTSLRTSKILLKWFNKYISPLQTDDKGVFSTSLSEEYQLAASTFDLQPSDLWRLSLSSIDSAFCDEQSKEKLREKWKLCKPHIEKRFNLKLWKSFGYQTQKTQEISIQLIRFHMFFCFIFYETKSKWLLYTVFRPAKKYFIFMETSTLATNVWPLLTIPPCCWAIARCREYA